MAHKLLRHKETGVVFVYAEAIAKLPMLEPYEEGSSILPQETAEVAAEVEPDDDEIDDDDLVDPDTGELLIQKKRNAPKKK